MCVGILLPSTDTVGDCMGSFHKPRHIKVDISKLDEIRRRNADGYSSAVFDRTIFFEIFLCDLDH